MSGGRGRVQECACGGESDRRRSGEEERGERQWARACHLERENALCMPRQIFSERSCALSSLSDLCVSSSVCTLYSSDVFSVLRVKPGMELPKTAPSMGVLVLVATHTHVRSRDHDMLR